MIWPGSVVRKGCVRRGAHVVGGVQDDIAIFVSRQSLVFLFVLRRCACEDKSRVNATNVCMNDGYSGLYWSFLP